MWQITAEGGGVGFFDRFNRAAGTTPRRVHDGGAGPPGEAAPAAVETSGRAQAQDLEFQEIATPELDRLASQLADSGQLRLHGSSAAAVESLRMDGPCPRCGHHFSQTRALNLPTSAVRRRHDDGPSRPVWADFLCDCGRPHPGARDGERGCGASFSLAWPRPTGGGDCAA